MVTHLYHVVINILINSIKRNIDKVFQFDTFSGIIMEIRNTISWNIINSP